jgi:DNA-binding LacI/PurR family transcriptional regulator
MNFAALSFHRMRVQRKPLAVLAAESLRMEITKRTWDTRLPGENRLSTQLGISRSTLRTALGILEEEGLIQTSQGSHRTIVSKGKTGRRSHVVSQDVNILLPVPFEQLPNYAIFWIDALRAQLHSTGSALNLIVSRASYREKSQRVRERLIEQHPAGCWILTFSKPDMQRWFQTRRIPTIVAGLPSPGIELPSVAINSHAIMFHLLGRLTARGHRRIALLTGHASSTMPLIFLRPFLETCRKIGADKITPEVMPLKDESSEHVGRAILKVLQRKDGPTAIVIFNPLNAVTALSYLPANGVSIPRDVSIVTTFGDSYLDHLNPPVCRYRYDSRLFANRLFETVRKIEMGMTDPQDSQIRIMLEPIEGQSIDVPREGPVVV